ncbi:MAG: N-6 DNA methylase [Parasphingorhabdus sp.]|uniref:HsdM family class I SAM-dependent methyltransferase n=1 Tax=Parasphingorhabdus sp. TaxID=2709688 RepID=UPI00329708C5
MGSSSTITDRSADHRLSPEEKCAAYNDRARRKKLGQFFTPPTLADIMVDWIAEIDPQTVLDPAIGPGMLLSRCQQKGVGEDFTGFDIDPVALKLAQSRLTGTQLLQRDFLSHSWAAKYDAILANPPYIIHREHGLADDLSAHIAMKTGVKISRRSNLYIYFVLKICEQLRVGGRAAILIPAEWMAANYGQALKRYLLDNGLLRGLVAMDCAGLAFADNMATASILLIEKTPAPLTQIDCFYVPTANPVCSLKQLREHSALVRTSLSAKALQTQKKWDRLLDGTALAGPKNPVKLGALVTTKRGIATGANRYFLLNQIEAEKQGLDIGRMDPCIGKAAHVADVKLTTADFHRGVSAGLACYLFNPKGKILPAERRYIARGEKMGIPLKHGPRTKKTWYASEIRETAPIWATAFGRERIRFVYNASGAKALTCFHGLYPQDLDHMQIRALVALLNSDPMQAIIIAQSRRYATGLMKLEPRDILDIAVPDIRAMACDIVKKLALWLDEGGADQPPRDQRSLNQLVALLFEGDDEIVDSHAQ